MVARAARDELIHDASSTARRQHETEPLHPALDISLWHVMADVFTFEHAGGPYGDWIVDEPRPQPTRQDHNPQCPKCKAPSRINLAMLDPKTGKMVNLYRCTSCGDRFWDD